MTRNIEDKTADRYVGEPGDARLLPPGAPIPAKPNPSSVGGQSA